MLKPIGTNLRPAVITLLAVSSGLGIGLAFGASAVALSPAAAHAIGTAITSVECSSKSSACVAGANSSIGPGTIGASASGYGLVGRSTSGIALLASSGNNTAVLATNNSQAPTISGKQSGSGPALSGSSAGMHGAIGVEGQAPYGKGLVGTTSGGMGVEGASQSGWGVYGNSTSGFGVVANSSTNVGLDALSQTSDAISATSQSGTGVVGTGGQGGYFTGTSGIGVAGTGLQGGYFTGTTGEGVYATESDYTYAIHGNDQSQGSENFRGDIGVFGESLYGPGGFFVEHRTDDDPPMPALIAQTATVGVGNYGMWAVDGEGRVDMSVDDNGNMDIFGNLYTNVPCIGCHGNNVRSYASMESAPTLEDVGKARLARGSAYVALDPAFLRVMNTADDYSVLVTPEGDSNGVFVAQHTSRGFLLRENRGGSSTLTVSYRIVATPVGRAQPRLPLVIRRRLAPIAHRENTPPRLPKIPGAGPHR